MIHPTALGRRAEAATAAHATTTSWRTKVRVQHRCRSSATPTKATDLFQQPLTVRRWELGSLLVQWSEFFPNWAGARELSFAQPARAASPGAASPRPPRACDASLVLALRPQLLVSTVSDPCVFFVPIDSSPRQDITSRRARRADMNGRNASGRPVSLLNDDLQASRPLRCQTKAVSYWEQASSVSVCMSPGRGSMPPTPDLLRSSSWSSRRTLDSPSPTTPADEEEDDEEEDEDEDGAENDEEDEDEDVDAYGVLDHEHRQRRPHEEAARAAPLTTFGPRRPMLLPKKRPEAPPPLLVTVPCERPDSGDSEMLDAPPAGLRPGAASSRAPSRSSRSSKSSMTMVSAKPAPKRYPCQFADTLDCREMFTTSGHASRHAKRHTGEKNVSCPRCRKPFARKDNMKQHLKTHDGARTGDRARSSAASRASDDVSSTSSPMTEMASPFVVPAAPTSRPPLRRSAATHDVPRQRGAGATSTSSSSSSSSSSQLLSPVAASSSPYPSPLFAHGLDALVLAADCHDVDRMSP
ncbi:MAG: hypothetical protein M1815_004786 [Lichina confinis]|nr:MAG: hypothetical protein M1815_004786 [Lichina confinis]